MKLKTAIEYWETAEGFGGYYEISSFGNLRSTDRVINYSNRRSGKWKGRNIKPTVKKDGYVRYPMSYNGKTKHISAHRLVAKAFIPNPENKRCVNHLDSNRSNNHVDNLQWVTDSENVQHSYTHGNRKPPCYGTCDLDANIELTTLIPMVDFILIHKPSKRQILAYAEFLDKELKLEYFICCDKDGKPLEKPDKPIWSDLDYEDCAYYENWIKEYQQACDRKIFTGFELYQYTYFNSCNCVIRSSDMVIVNIENKTIEDIAPLKVEVTDRISKQLNIRLWKLFYN